MYWEPISKYTHPNAIKMLFANPHKIHWDNLCYNQHPDVIKLLAANKQNINWYNLCANPAAVSIIKEHIEDIRDDDLLRLSINPVGIELLENNRYMQREVQSAWCENPAIFKYVYNSRLFKMFD
jgi:hypothetical protein